MNNTVSFFDGLFVLLNIDQLNNGLWGRSIWDRLSTSLEQGRESLTVSYWAIEALHDYTKDNSYPAIKKYLEEMERHKDSQTGAFGRLVRFTNDSRVTQPFKIEINIRHTATHIKTLLHLQHSINLQILEAIKYGSPVYGGKSNTK